MWRMSTFLTVILFYLFSEINGQGEQCYAPNNYIGLCVILPQCPSLVNYYGRYQQNPQVIRYLLTAQRNCGTRRIGDNPIVCCDNPIINRPIVQPIQPQPNEVPKEIPDEIPEEISRENPVTQPTLPVTTKASVVVSTVPASLNGTTCIDPKGVNGDCRNIRECPKILDEVIARNNDPRYVYYIKMSNANCGNVQPLICCPHVEKTPEQPDTLNEPTTSVTSIEQSSVQGRFLTPEEGCGYTTAKYTRVVGGRNAIEGAWPWMALLGYENNLGEKSWKCGGSLITTRHVLTAAHCVLSTLSLARLGEHDISSTTDGPVQDIKIVRSVKHPEYDKKDGTSDLAVLYLEHDAQLSTRVNPICMPIEESIRSKSYVRYRPFVAGWGRLQEGGKSSNILQQLQLPILDNSQCQTRYKKQNKLFSEKQFSDRVICAGVLSGGMDSCQGDSGGPLMQAEDYIPRDHTSLTDSNEMKRFYQIGIISYGIGCARTDVPGVYTSVQHFIDWIQEKVNENY